MPPTPSIVADTRLLTPTKSSFICFFNPSDLTCESRRARGARVSAGDGSSGGGPAGSGVVLICIGIRGPVVPIYQRRPGGLMVLCFFAEKQRS
ncbi:hypothetical protein SORBI_3005G108900 [Sorghum bicolor]|uniref:Uncharacterized protein n=1 Tax=Sorghum bicolor TaxID=4558 RepID=A0A1B6PRM4_SORBI|nr:hypothetical protein SORBI_3005G108900 [Sorghum bicolor]